MKDPYNAGRGALNIGIVKKKQSLCFQRRGWGGSHKEISKKAKNKRCVGKREKKE